MKNKILAAGFLFACISSAEAINMCKNEYYSDAEGKTLQATEQAAVQEMWGNKKIKKSNDCDLCWDGGLVMAKQKCKDASIKSYRRFCQKTSIFLTNGGPDKSARLDLCPAKK